MKTNVARRCGAPQRTPAKGVAQRPTARKSARPRCYLPSSMCVAILPRPGIAPRRVPAPKNCAILSSCLVSSCSVVLFCTAAAVGPELTRHERPPPGWGQFTSRRGHPAEGNIYMLQSSDQPPYCTGNSGSFWGAGGRMPPAPLGRSCMRRTDLRLHVAPGAAGGTARRVGGGRG